MANVTAIYQTPSHFWGKTLAPLLPLWLLSFAIMAEGFPPPPISIEIAAIALALAIVVSLGLLWKRWMTIELVLYNLRPLFLLSTFDEISTAYKTPFILLCALSLTLGGIGYQTGRSTRFGRGLILLVAALATLALAWHATTNFWEMASELGYVQCFPDAHGCPPLNGQAAPWWVLFFSL